MPYSVYRRFFASCIYATLPACYVLSAATGRRAVPQCFHQLSLHCSFVVMSCDAKFSVCSFVFLFLFPPSTFHFFLYIAFLHKTRTSLSYPITMPVLLRFCSMLQALVQAQREFGLYTLRLQQLVYTLLVDAAAAAD